LLLFFSDSNRVSTEVRMIKLFHLSNKSHHLAFNLVILSVNTVVISFLKKFSPTG
jgi:hypothetical protein